MNQPITITEDEKESKLWKKLKEHIETRLDLLRKKNDGNLDEFETARLRGRISELKSFFALDKEVPEIE